MVAGNRGSYDYRNESDGLFGTRFAIARLSYGRRHQPRLDRLLRIQSREVALAI